MNRSASCSNPRSGAQQRRGQRRRPTARYAVRYSDSYFFGARLRLVSELERAGFDAGMPTRAVPVTYHRVIPIEQTTAEVIWATGGFVDTWRNDDRVVEVAVYDPRSDDERAEYDASGRPRSTTSKRTASTIWYPSSTPTCSRCTSTSTLAGISGPRRADALPRPGAAVFIGPPA